MYKLILLHFIFIKLVPPYSQAKRYSGEFVGFTGKAIAHSENASKCYKSTKTHTSIQTKHALTALTRNSDGQYSKKC
jgi:hypothetical protein